jgi:hypothetical protein
MYYIVEQVLATLSCVEVPEKIVRKDSPAFNTTSTGDETSGRLIDESVIYAKVIRLTAECIGGDVLTMIGLAIVRVTHQLGILARYFLW